MQVYRRQQPALCQADVSAAVLPLLLCGVQQLVQCVQLQLYMHCLIMTNC
jgi:hypothetical protein